MVLLAQAVMQDRHVSSERRKIIIDTDPGIDDAMAIFMALRSPELEIVGITTIFGNAQTPVATRNALYLLEVAGSSGIPVSEGCLEPSVGGPPLIQDFGNGSDGLGDTITTEPSLKKSTISASDFLVEKILEFPGEITVVALGPLTNLQQAFQKEETLAKKVQHIVVHGGAFFSSGNVNPAAEANIYCDPEAADYVFSCGAHVTVVGINITTQILLDDTDLSALNDSSKGHRKCLHDMCKSYRQWHNKMDGIDGVFLHGPTCLSAVIAPSLFTYKIGTLRVETSGVCRGHTLFDMGLKRWNTANPWVEKPQVNVAWTVDAHSVLQLVRDRLCASLD